MSLVYRDTMLFVYLLEADPQFGTRTKQIRAKMLERGDTLRTSIFTVGEVLTGFYKRGVRDRAGEVREVLQPPALQLLPFEADTAERYAQIRAGHRVTLADGIHLATASVAKANLFLTNDASVSKLTVAGIDFVAGLNVNLF